MTAEKSRLIFTLVGMVNKNSSVHICSEKQPAVSQLQGTTEATVMAQVANLQVKIT